MHVLLVFDRATPAAPRRGGETCRQEAGSWLLELVVAAILAPVTRPQHDRKQRRDGGGGPASTHQA
jgi:hypothetical protein